MDIAVPPMTDTVSLREELEAVGIEAILARAAETCTPLKSALEVWKNVTFNYESTDMPDYVPTPSVAM